jgi:hypothetical protein
MRVESRTEMTKELYDKSGKGNFKCHIENANTEFPVSFIFTNKDGEKFGVDEDYIDEFVDFLHNLQT